MKGIRLLSNASRFARSPCRNAYAFNIQPPQRFLSTNSNDKSPTLPVAEYHEIVDNALDEIVDRIFDLQLDDKLDSDLSSGVLKIQTSEGKHWVINKQTPNQQIWWSSPISGPLRFEYVPNSNDGNGYKHLHNWECTRDKGVTLSALLKKELNI